MAIKREHIEVEALIERTEYEVEDRIITRCTLIMANGSTIIASARPSDPRRYNRQRGELAAYERAKKLAYLQLQSQARHRCEEETNPPTRSTASRG